MKVVDKDQFESQTYLLHLPALYFQIGGTWFCVLGEARNFVKMSVNTRFIPKVIFPRP